MTQLQALLDAVQPLDSSAMSAVQDRLNILTKPQGSLGRLEELAVQLAGIQRTHRPTATPAAVTVMAGDHGVTAEGVSPFPPAVTVQMVHNFLAGGAAINVLAKVAGAAVYVADLGVNYDWPAQLGNERLLVCKVRHGTRNMAVEAAMTTAEATAAILAGAHVADRLVANGMRVLAIGEMGIGNSTPATALLCAFTGSDPDVVVGKGTGLDVAGVKHKAQVIRRALQLHRPGSTNPLEALAAVGGLEIAGMAGYMLRAAALHCPVIIDGLISTSAALVACHLCPAVQPYLIPSHVSQEPGHQVMLAHLHLQAPLHLDMRLGEGTGAVMMLPILRAATEMLEGMSTFAEAGVSGRVQ